MQFTVELKIEPSASGKTFGLAFHKPGAEKPLCVMKGCKIASGQNGPFATGPSTKLDDGKWFNYLFMDKAFNDYVTKEALAVMDAPKQSGGSDSDSIPF